MLSQKHRNPLNKKRERDLLSQNHKTQKQRDMWMIRQREEEENRDKKRGEIKRGKERCEKE